MENTKLEQLQTEVNQLDHKGLWFYLEKSRLMKKEAETIESLVKDRCKLLMGNDEQMALDGDAGVYIQYSPRYEVSVFSAKQVVADEDLLELITKVDMTKAKEVLPQTVFLELQTKKQIIGEPTRKLMVGKIKKMV